MDSLAGLQRSSSSSCMHAHMQPKTPRTAVAAAPVLLIYGQEYVGPQLRLDVWDACVERGVAKKKFDLTDCAKASTVARAHAPFWRLPCAPFHLLPTNLELGQYPSLVQRACDYLLVLCVRARGMRAGRVFCTARSLEKFCARAHKTRLLERYSYAFSPPSTIHTSLSSSILIVSFSSTA